MADSKDERTLTPEEQTLWDEVARSLTPIEKRRILETITKDREAAAVAVPQEPTVGVPPPDSSMSMEDLPDQAAAERAAGRARATEAVVDDDVIILPAETIPEPPQEPYRLTQEYEPEEDDRDIIRKLKRGQLQIDATLDMHGMSQERAHRELLSFVERAYDRGVRCALIITGKGTGYRPSTMNFNDPNVGVLRANVPSWLVSGPIKDKLISYCRAQQMHGGEGALYILLKRKR